jgi:PAS domain S-box-containing protein
MKGEGEQEPLDGALQWHTLAEAIPQILWATRPDGSPLYFNTRWYHYTGLGREESLRAGWSKPVHPNDLGHAVALWEQATATGEPLEIECRLRGADGSYRWFLGRAMPRGGDSGMITCWLGTCTDIDDQKRVQEELRRSEERFRLLAEAIPHKIWMADARGEVNYLNKSWLDYSGLTVEDVDRRGWLRAVHPADCDATVEQWTRTVAEGGYLEIEQRLRRGADGAYRWHLVRGAPLRDETGRIIQWIGTVTDIDDQRRQAELIERLVREQTSELHRSNRQLEQFASVASHDLQEPLRKIQAFGDRLQAKCGPSLGKQGKEYLDRILNSAARMRNLINDLLAYSRVATRSAPLMPVDLEAIAREVVSDLEGLIQLTGGHVELGPLPTIQADPLQVRQLFQNLIGNGLKFHYPERPPTVRVTARAVDAPADLAGTPGIPWYEIAIEDNGIGFEEIDLDRIFQVFQRLHGRGDYEGTGMGLAICREIVERHRGRITARSMPGQGATFLVTLLSRPGDSGKIPARGRRAPRGPRGAC